ncbi:MAG: type II toxin-antitoxin system VapC family toxin [Actinomycetota bacterium]
MGSQKIIVDTSVWIEYFKNNKEYAPFIDDNLNLENILITGIIISELLQGVKGSKEYDMLSSSIVAIPYIECIYEDWVKTGKMLYDLRKKGISIPLTDALIAAIALRNNASVWTLDKYFKGISLVTTLDIYQHK